MSKSITGLIGHPVKHSLSPKLHNQWYEEQELNFEYKLFDIPPTKLREFFKSLPNNLRGLSVTVPHKESVRKFLHTESPATKKIGACNTIIIDDKTKQLHGENTDWEGWLIAFKNQSQLKLATANILVAGAGGGARAIIFALKHEGCSNITIVNRTQEKANLLAKEFNCLTETTSSAQYNLLINTTSLGLNPNDPSPFPEKIINEQTIVSDLIYQSETQLERICKQKKATYINGYQMLVEQAKLQHQLFTQLN